MVSGSSDNNVMIWTCPLDNYQGEKIEGIDNTNTRATFSDLDNHKTLHNPQQNQKVIIP